MNYTCMIFDKLYIQFSQVYLVNLKQMQVNILRFKFWTLASVIFSATKRNFPGRIHTTKGDDDEGNEP